MKFTKAQHSIISHRLGVPDCIAQAMTDLTDEMKAEVLSEGEIIYEFDTVCAVAHDLCIRWDKSLKQDIESMTDLEKLIIRDCVEGSVVLSCDDWDEHATRGTVRAMQNLKEKLENIEGFENMSMPI